MKQNEKAHRFGVNEEAHRVGVNEEAHRVGVNEEAYRVGLVRKIGCEGWQRNGERQGNTFHV